MDPYIYPNTNTLINKLNIRDKQQLIDVEAQLLIAEIVDISSITHEIDFQKYESLQMIHHFLFHELYSWAGEFRTVNIFKSEHVLNGLSVAYSDKDHIVSDLKTVFSWSKSKQWKYSNPRLVEDFSTFMTKLWRVHPYREGNTRAVSIFMKLFAEANRLDFNAQLLSQHVGYLRNALVLAAVEEAPEPQYLLNMMTDALDVVDFNKFKPDDEASSNYQVIGQYDVSKYEEKPFETDFDKE
ncbi:fic/DOC family protein [Lysinibacillus sp. FJAT-14745]|uniref:Fic/DOC family protein n=1 Tax=Lysinibacillus sp. FJAT-14745 TaxID=1704289 RepID=UPI0006AB9CA7|nr:Fic family protein [Lysinibacillus sp. FJAT-14745]KOP78370.1 fic/DOC family protein [Lysinibacillus sp. FJAT-14745]